MTIRSLTTFLLLLVAQAALLAQVRLPRILGSNMVLQRNKPLPVWGWAAPGTPVTVLFAGQRKTTTAAADSSWKVVLSPLKASAEPRDMTITAGTATTLTNILVGEVWLCSGQSNMEYTMKLGPGYVKPQKGIDSAALELANRYADIRIFKVEKVLSLPDVTSTGWNECAGTAMEQFSAVGFYFAKKIRQELDIPIGVISSAWGGSRIEPWTPAEGYQALPAFAAAAGQTPYRIDSVAPGRYYRSMIRPLGPFALRGFLWYQGESNCMLNEEMRYADKMQALVESWRRQWESDALPFYSVQIAPYYYTRRKDPLPHTPETEPEFWEAQALSAKIPHTATVVITDLVDNLSDIHPPYKWEVGRRLALVALANDYGKKVVSSGPVFKSMRVNNGHAVLSFAHAEGLQSIDALPLTWFTIAGEDGRFVPATAAIKGSTVTVSAPGITKPTAIRFAWNETAMPNLFNAAGLPAAPFRTDPAKWK